MKIYNQTKTQQIINPDLELGYLVDDSIQIGQTLLVAEIQEQGHYKVEKEYPNGGKDMRWVVDVAYVSPKSSEPIFEKIKVYIPLTVEEIKEKKEQQFSMQYKQQINELQDAIDYLNQTDYKAIKFAEGVITAAEFEPVKTCRQAARTKVRALQEFITSARANCNL